MVQVAFEGPSAAGANVTVSVSAVPAGMTVPSARVDVAAKPPTTGGFDLRIVIGLPPPFATVKLNDAVPDRPTLPKATVPGTTRSDGSAVRAASGTAAVVWSVVIATVSVYGVGLVPDWSGGVNVTVIAMAAPAAITVPGVGAPVTPNGAVGSLIDWMVCAVAPVFVNVTDEVAICDPPGTVPKSMLAGDVPIGSVGACPSPLIGMLETPLSVVTLRVPATGPKLLGVNCTGTVMVSLWLRFAGSAGDGVPTLKSALSAEIAVTSAARVAVRVTEAGAVAPSVVGPNASDGPVERGTGTGGAEREYVAVTCPHVDAPVVDEGRGELARRADRRMETQRRRASVRNRVVPPRSSTERATSVEGVHDPHERRAALRAVGGHDRWTRSEAEDVARGRGQTQRGISHAVDDPLVHTQIPRRPGHAGSRAGRGEVHISTVAGPDRGLAPHPAERPELPEDVVGCRATPTEMVAIEQVHVSLFPRADEEMRVGRRPEAVRQAGHAARSEILVVQIQRIGVERREEIGGCKRSVGLDGETHHRLAEPDGRRRAESGANGRRRTVAGRQDDLTRRIRHEGRARHPDARAGVVRVFARPHRRHRSGRGEADDIPAIRAHVAMPAERGVDNSVHEQQAGPLQLVGGVERGARRVRGHAADDDRPTRPLGSGDDVDGVRDVLRGPRCPAHVRLREEVRGARCGVDSRRARDADRGREITTTDVEWVERNPVVLMPAGGTADRVDAVHVVGLGGNKQGVARDERLRVHLTRDGRGEQLTEARPADDGRRQRRFVAVPAGPEVVGGRDDRVGAPRRRREYGQPERGGSDHDRDVHQRGSETAGCRTRPHGTLAIGRDGVDASERRHTEYAPVPYVVRNGIVATS